MATPAELAILQAQIDAARAAQITAAREKAIREGTQRIDAIFDGTKTLQGYTGPVGQQTFDLSTLVDSTGRAVDWKNLPPGLTYTPATAATPGTPGGGRTPGSAGTAAQPARITDSAGNVLWTQTGTALPSGTIKYTGPGAVYTTTGGFGDFLDAFKNDYIHLGQLDLNKQYGLARDNLTYALARAGLLSSSVANQRVSRLAADNAEGQGKIQLDANSAQNKIKQNLENDRQTALAQLYATEDPDAASAAALHKASAYEGMTPDYNPLGDIFSGVVSGIGSAIKGARASMSAIPSSGYTPSAVSAGTGTVG